ncbi:MAG: alpha/beta fold hydrolase [Actinomycetota bacterium]|nr:alpha/beta fold hydrolase [Actinomycetota bacterium]
MGDRAQPTLLLIPGLGGQLTGWPEKFCADLASRGFFLVRFDNRDAGLSTSIEGGPVADPMAVYLGDRSSVSYTLEDMADDAGGLIDALGIGAAHLVGISMGGMIAQALAARHPSKTLSLCSISSTTGEGSVGQPTAEAFELLARPPATTREEYVEAGVASHQVLGSRPYPTDEAEMRARAADRYDRGFNPQGVARQLCAILASGDRTASLAKISAPTLVVHGTEDALIQPSGGEATAKAIPGAELLMIEGMGHDLPSGVWPQVVDAVVANAARAHQ